MSGSDLNPYQSPSLPAEPVWAVGVDARAGVEIVSVRRGWRWRRIVFGGRLTAEVEWNARWPLEVVRFNGRIAASNLYSFWYTPRFVATLATPQGNEELAVEVRLGLLDRLREFRVQWSGEVIYEERQ